VRGLRHVTLCERYKVVEEDVRERAVTYENLRVWNAEVELELSNRAFTGLQTVVLILVWR
jgi:hypothetical protein